MKQETGLEFSLLPLLTNDVHIFRLTLHKPFFIFLIENCEYVENAIYIAVEHLSCSTAYKPDSYRSLSFAVFRIQMVSDQSINN